MFLNNNEFVIIVYKHIQFIIIYHVIIIQNSFEQLK